MAIDYITANTGLFYRLGKFIKYIDTHAAEATTTLPAELKAIADPFELADMAVQIAPLYGDYKGWQDAVVQLRNRLASYSDTIFTDRVTVLEQLKLTAPDLIAVLAELPRQMIVDAQTVNASVVSLGSVTAASGNVGNGTVLLTKILDGSTPPLADGSASLLYSGVNSELAVPAETMTFTCIRDSGRDGTAEGAEQFSWNGGVADTTFGYSTEGSGTGPAITCAGASTLATDGSFENWTSTNTPTNWDIVDGTAGTHILRESSVIYRGTYALKFTGDGAKAVIGVSQTPGSGVLKARKMYHVSLRMRASAAAPAAGDFACLFTGTGYTAGATEQIAVAHGALVNTFTLYNFFVIMPTSFPSDFKLVVKVTGTLTNAVSVYVDSLCLAEVPYHGGVGAVVVPGSTRFVVNDRFTAANTNSEGVFQRMWRRKYRMQLPSDNAAGETIADNLAQ